jgi:hypothetical protein
MSHYLTAASSSGAHAAEPTMGRVYALLSSGAGRRIERTAMADDLTVLIANLGRLDDLLPCLESLFESVGDELSMRVIVGFNLRGDSDSPRKLRDVFPAVEQLRAPNKLGH